ncbi:MAG: hypothetical protein HY777_04045 [Betaproteobacteria bacterium]|nr:hypothetical protein [Betaproteobacteria bacterium]
MSAKASSGDRLSAALKQANEAARELIAIIQGHDARIAELYEQRQAIGREPVTKAEFMGYMGAHFDDKAGLVAKTITHALSKVDLSFFAREMGAGLGIQYLTSDRNVPSVMTDDAAYWLLKPLLLQRMEECAEQLDFADPATAVPLAQRRAKIAQIDAEIAEIRAERTELSSKLQNVGMAV